ncbi:MAG: [Fe-Fe] hydrogenase large subunit C-terminal domain-containing protein [Bacilli bacterium]|jgi:iron only hydrogenase large subunit-like protein/uncharacterized Fe-S cluster-containing protein|nr:[Fe-Fe] hydrogenase large subunit C-terminal domain-containing protein [Bacilli bacterium]MDD3069121.1 [Fe-Fe] hydrogenase large subunit C-terminal domain-containing protein [Bacilli bacterium]MDD3841524.1 [Fe-Fe] hydrogenase large subunit C-terminal domain-containing protein [Bacilli bacterium]
MLYPLESKTNNCKNCYKCIRNCPVKAISFFENKASILHDACILCGKCYLVCPQGVKVVRDDVKRVLALLIKKEKVVISLAPSFLNSFENISFKQIQEAAKKCGFFEVEETAIGATIVKNAYDEMVNKNEQSIIISSCCPSINLLISKHFPDCVPYLAPVLTPMLTHAKYIKARYGEETKVVFVGPCIAKKHEADENKDLVEAAISFDDLNMIFSKFDIELKEDLQTYVDHSKARFFPTCGGIIKTMKQDNPKYKYLSIDGVENAMRALSDIKHGNIDHCFIEMSACPGSCVNGPLIGNFHRSVLKGYYMVEKSAGKKDFCLTDEEVDIAHQYEPSNLKESIPSEEEINRVLIATGKPTIADRLDCGSCGYPSCRDKAIAIIQGKAVKEMCLPELIKRANSFSDRLVKTFHEGLIVVDSDLKIKLINRYMADLVGVKKISDVIGKDVSFILDPAYFIKTFEDKKNFHQVILMGEYNTYIDLSIFYDEDSNVLIGAYKNVTKEIIEEKEQQEKINKTIQLADEILLKNMKSVQEIASLLGETTASTKVALKNITETIKK